MRERRWWRRGPDARLARERYARLAATYDPSALEPLRRRAVAQLAAGPGATVLDVGCGTGGSFAQIEAEIGPAGRLIGVDQCPEMLARARARVRDAGWENVTLVESAADAMPAVGPVDRALIFYVHDVMRSPADLDRILAQVRPGGRVIAAGPRWAPWWAFPLSLWVWHIARPYHTTFEGFRRPWSHLAARTASLHVERTVFGRAYLAYIAVARVR